MISNIEKIIFACIVAIHMFWLVLISMVGEGIVFGTRSFDEVIRTFTGLEILLTIISTVFIYKNNKIGYVIFAISLLSTYVIIFGHRLGWWPCPYCQL